MIQSIGKQIIQCQNCETEHESEILAFPKKIQYKDQIILANEFYHTCPVRQEFYQTDIDINQSWISEKVSKKQFDAMQQQQEQSFTINFGPGM